MAKRILCAIDFTEASKTALVWAVNFSKEHHCNLSILYAYRLTKNMPGEVSMWKKKMEDDAVGKFASFENDCLKTQDVSYDFKIEIGFIADRIQDHARKNEISFVVMDKDMCAGKDTFDDLIEHLNIPLIIIP